MCERAEGGRQSVLKEDLSIAHMLADNFGGDYHGLIKRELRSLKVGE